MAVEVGRFKWDGQTVEGPAGYMKERFPEMLEQVKEGKSIVYNMAFEVNPGRCDPVGALLVALQTDYAGWLGMKEMKSWSKS